MGSLTEVVNRFFGAVHRQIVNCSHYNNFGFRHSNLFNVIYHLTSWCSTIFEKLSLGSQPGKHMQN